MFKPPSFIPAYAPEFIYDLPITANPREFRGIFNRLIPSLNKAFMKLKYSANGNMQYQILSDKGLKNINLFSFSDLYDYLRDKRTRQIQPWKQKWENELAIDPSEWPLVWSNVHHFSIVYKVQSSLWELLHRNYMCAYFAKIIFQDTGICKLCNRDQNERTHIFLTCNIINSVYGVFLPLLDKILYIGIVSHKEKVIGIKIDPNNHDRDILRNYITSTIKHVVYRNQNVKFGDFQKTIDSLVKKIRNFLKNDVHMKHKMATHTNS